MILKIKPKNNQTITTMKLQPLSGSLDVGIVGNFSTPESSNFGFSHALENHPKIKRVFKFDYREELKQGIINFRPKFSKLCRSSDLVIICKGNTIPKESIISNCHTTRFFLWYMDWYNQLKSSFELKDYCKYCAYRSATGMETAGLWANEMNIPVYFILDGLDPKKYYKEDRKKIYDVTFIGDSDEERGTLYKILKDTKINVKFFGPKFNKTIGFDEFRKICNESKITLNISRSKYIGYSSLRLWNLLGCGSLVMTKKIPEMEKLFGLIPNEHIVEFENILELNNKILYYLNCKDEREKISEAGRNFVLNEKTWDNSVSSIMNIVTNLKGDIIDYRISVESNIKKTRYW